MEDKNRNGYFIKNLVFNLNQIKHSDDSLSDFKTFIIDITFSENEKYSLYAKCVEELKKINDLENIMYIKKAKEICTYFLEIATGIRNNPIKNHTENRKKKYKQLNLDMPIDLMERFEKCLDKNNHQKKPIIKRAIEEYLKENEKDS